MIELVMKGMFLGVGVLTLLSNATFIKRKRAIAINNELLNSAILVACLAAISFLIISLLNIYQDFTQATSEDTGFAIANRMFGPYWLTYWISNLAKPLTYLILTQILWFRRFNSQSIQRTSLALLILLVPVLEFVLISLVSMNQGFLPSSWMIIENSNLLVEWGIQLTVFAVVVATTYMIRTKIKSIL